MIPQELIRRKRDGGELSDEEFDRAEDLLLLRLQEATDHAMEVSDRSQPMVGPPVWLPHLLIPPGEPACFVIVLFASHLSLRVVPARPCSFFRREERTRLQCH